MTVAAFFIFAFGLNPVQGTWQYQARNKEGKVIAHGPITFRDAIYISLRPREKAWRYFATYEIKELDSGRYGPHGAKRGQVSLNMMGADCASNGEFLADMGNSFPSKVILAGLRDSSRVKGTWTWLTPYGPGASGTFTLTKVHGSRVH